MGTIDQRRSARVEIKIAAEVYTESDVVHAFTRNLSTTGVCLELENAIIEGNTVGVSLFLTQEGIEDPDHEPLNIKATVVWCSERDNGGFSAGARFDELESRHMTQLQHFLSQVGED